MRTALEIIAGDRKVDALLHDAMPRVFNGTVNFRIEFPDCTVMEHPDIANEYILTRWPSPEPTDLGSTPGHSPGNVDVSGILSRLWGKS